MSSSSSSASTTTTTHPTATLMVASSVSEIPSLLQEAVVRSCHQALQEHNSFTVALSGGSLPSFLTTLPETFARLGVDPQWPRWHIFLADERCVSMEDPDSNLGALRKHFLVPLQAYYQEAHASLQPAPTITAHQVHGLNTSIVSLLLHAEEDSAEETFAMQLLADDYAGQLKSVLEDHSGGRLDCAVLGFGPDGHTCSLFPDHPLVTTPGDGASLEAHGAWVAPVTHSPKPPPRRITLTLPVLNHRTRQVIFCGAGSAKSPVLQKVWTGQVMMTNEEQEGGGTRRYVAALADPPVFPCAMVRPTAHPNEEITSLTWIVDQEAMEGITLTPSAGGL